MARKPRIHFSGALYRVNARGNKGQDEKFALEMQELERDLIKGRLKKIRN